MMLCGGAGPGDILSQGHGVEPNGERIGIYIPGAGPTGKWKSPASGAEAKGTKGMRPLH